MHCGITGGDDYELLFTVRPRTRGRLKAAMRPDDTPLTRIGVCTADRAVFLRGEQGRGPADAGRIQSLPMIHLTKAAGPAVAGHAAARRRHARSAPRRHSRSASSSASRRSSASTRSWASPSRSCSTTTASPSSSGVYSNLPWIIAPYYALATMFVGAPLTRASDSAGVPPAGRATCSSCLSTRATSGTSWSRILRPFFWPYTVGSLLGALVLAGIAYPLALAFLTSRRRIKHLIHSSD